MWWNMPGMMGSGFMFMTLSSVLMWLLIIGVVVAVGVFAAGVMAGWLGWTYRPRTPLALTRKSLKEDWKWLKDLVA